MDEIIYDSRPISKILDKVKNLHERTQSAPVQRSDEWLEYRKTIIGGSEISCILGENSFMSEYDLVLKKLNPDNNFGNVYTRWGIVMEEITNRIMELIFDTTISEFGSIKGEIRGQSFSPDGIGVVKLWCDKNVIEVPSGLTFVQNEGKYPFVVLFEYKAPFSRIPSGKIPKEYIHQVKTGIAAIKEIEYGLFVNALYRICPLSSLRCNEEYNDNFHWRDKTRKTNQYFGNKSPIAMGIMVIYQTDEQKEDFFGDNYHDDYHEDDMLLRLIDPIEKKKRDRKIRLNRKKIDSHEKFVNSIIADNEFDMGSMGRRQTERIFELITKGHINVRYIDPFIIKKNLWRIEFLYNQNVDISNCKKKDALSEREMYKFLSDEIYKARIEIEQSGEIIGLLPWKLFECDIILQEPDANYANFIQPHIDRVLKVIKSIKNDPKSQDAILKKNYPDKYKNFEEDTAEDADMGTISSNLRDFW